MKIDVLMLSYAKTPELLNMTKEALKSLQESEKDYKFNVILLETEKSDFVDYSEFDNVTVIKPTIPFNYNKYLNIGYSYIKDSDYVIIANNDVWFYPNWFSNIIIEFDKFNLDSASPLEPTLPYPYWNGIDTTWLGYGLGVKYYGWLLVYKYNSISKMFPLDEQFSFICQDSDMEHTARDLNLVHGLVFSSKVRHYGSITHQYLNNDEEYFSLNEERYKIKYNNEVYKF